MPANLSWHKICRRERKALTTALGGKVSFRECGIQCCWLAALSALGLLPLWRGSLIRQIVIAAPQRSVRRPTKGNVPVVLQAMIALTNSRAIRHRDNCRGRDRYVRHRVLIEDLDATVTVRGLWGRRW